MIHDLSVVVQAFRPAVCADLKVCTTQDQFLVISSCRFSMARATVVMAAS